MKNQYCGDINDYRKYGLLRALRSAIKDRFLVAWMLTPDDGGTDGRFRAYLEEPERWRCHDPDLYDGLRDLLRTAPEPEVSLIERTDLLPDTKYYSTEVPDRRDARATWQQELFELARDVDLVFVDPDNGIEVQGRLPPSPALAACTRGDAPAARAARLSPAAGRSGLVSLVPPVNVVRLGTLALRPVPILS